MIWLQRERVAGPEWSCRGCNNKPELSYQYMTIRELETNSSSASYYIFTTICSSWFVRLHIPYLSWGYRSQRQFVFLAARLRNKKAFAQTRDARMIIFRQNKKQQQGIWCAFVCMCLTWAPYTYLSSIFPPSVWPPMSHTCRVTFKLPAVEKRDRIV